MTALVVVLMFVGFVFLDFAVRAAGRRLAERRDRRVREEVLTTSLRLDFTHEAKSLKRVEVPHPKARILAVDDEPVVLDSFRKILVLDGFNVDTVETGPEALGLVRRHDYDFVFTDLKMPEMDGVEVVKAVRHLRPDIDVAVITGYATIESAVETMQHGAIDYVQKPFTLEELTDFARRLLIKRQARLDAQRRPTVRVVAPAMAEIAAGHEYCVPGGAFLSGGHAWARLEPGGQVRVGMDDFARKGLGLVEGVDLPAPGRTIARGEPLFTLRRGGKSARICSPVSGRVVRVNEVLRDEPARLISSPYDRGWACLIQPSNLAGDLPVLKIGQPVVAWYQEEIARLREAGGPAEGGTPGVDWSAFEARFLSAGVPVHN
ncbi:MAG TPA: response regulator [Candidatus Polarisedimenticolia bacterium]|nr:response regulator [Candidatus Polarisedimenticolia bacterium]